MLTLVASGSTQTLTYTVPRRCVLLGIDWYWQVQDANVAATSSTYEFLLRTATGPTGVAIEDQTLLVSDIITITTTANLSEGLRFHARYIHAYKLLERFQDLFLSCQANAASVSYVRAGIIFDEMKER